MKGGTVRSMTIEPAKGGFTSTTRRSGPKGEYMEPELPTIHPSVQHLQSHIGKVFGKGGGISPLKRPALAPSKAAPQQAAIAGKMLG